MRLIALVFLALSLPVHAVAANRLAGLPSPYLQQHAENPVDWYPWGPEALEKAAKEGKPIFVSVGYSSCHWCHVMREESFENDAIAALLNAHFVSIKIDRERRPDLDEQFQFATQLLAGTGGWPNSVFLTPQGDPFFAGGYFPPDVFRSVLFQVGAAWQEDPAFVSTEAARVTKAISRLLTRTADARELDPEALHAAARSLLDEMDGFHGGLGVAPKFPREPLFLFLLDQAQRNGDDDLLVAVTDMLDGMIMGGVHDHVGGGFHRYSVDPDWHRPHFEKMLYTQALTARLLLRAWDITGAHRYRRAAERTLDYVLRELRDPTGGFYSAQDADSLDATGESVEGAYYTWTPEALVPLGDRAGVIADIYQVTPGGDLEGADVLNLRALPDELAAEAGADPEEFTAALDATLQEMAVLRAARPAPFLDRKIVLSWNAAMIETLAEAAQLLDRPDYFAAAEAAAEFLLSSMPGPGGLYRIRFEGKAGIDAQLADYAGFGLALLALHDFALERGDAARWLTGARDMAKAVRGRFGDAETGFRMTEARDGLTDVLPVDDTELPSGNALALTLLARLGTRMQAAEIELEALRLAGALAGRAIDLPEQRGFALKAIAELRAGQAGPLRHAAKGTVRAELHRNSETGEIAIAIEVADGWHINAHEPLEEYFVPTALAVNGQPASPDHYPAPVVKALSFNEAPLALYEGALRLAAPPPETPGAVTLVLQACSDEVCLQPEELQWWLW